MSARCLRALGWAAAVAAALLVLWVVFLAIWVTFLTISGTNPALGERVGRALLAWFLASLVVFPLLCFAADDAFATAREAAR